jgi:hypothetical protein
MGIAALALVAHLVEPAAPASPAGSGVVVVWEAPASCPTRDEVARAVARGVGERPVEVRATVVEADATFTASLELRSTTGTSTRTLASPACATLVDAVVLLAVVATDPVPTLESIAPRLQEETAIPQPTVAAPPVEPLPMIAATPVAAPAPARTETKAPRSRIQPRIAAFAVLGGRTLPGLDVGIRGVIGVATPHVHVDLTALYLGARTLEEDEVRTTIDAWSVGLRVCPLVPLPTTRVELPICAVAGAGQLRGRAAGEPLVASTPQSAPWVTLAAAPELAIVLHRLVRIVAGVEVGGTLVGPGFTVDTLGRVWKPSPWIARGHLGLEVRFR